MRRRDFITLAGGTFAALPIAAGAQQPGKVRRVAVLMGGLAQNDAGGQAEAAAFEAGLKELGWTPGRNISLDYRWPGAELAEVHAAANAIAASRPDVAVTRSTPATDALMNSSLAMVFVLVVDPLGSHFVPNLARPGGNVTGFSNFESSVAGKWIEILKEAAPSVTHVSLLFNPTTAPFATGYLRSAREAAQTLEATIVAAPCNNADDIDSAFAASAGGTGGGIIAIPDTFLTEHRDTITTAATHYRLPAIYGVRAYTQSGGLISYSADFPEIFRRSAGYVDRILKGEKPGDLPVEEPAKFMLSVNLKAAHAIGLTLPQSLIVRADEVIE